MFLIPFSLLFPLSEPDISNAQSVPPPVATFSIVGYDAETGALVLPCNPNFSPLARLSRGAEAGVGAIATQSWANTTYRPERVETPQKWTFRGTDFGTSHCR